MDERIEKTLLQLNPWLRSPGMWEPLWRQRLPKTMLPRRVGVLLEEALGRENRAVLVVGPRQSGKSTLVWNSLGQRGPTVLFANGEERLVREWCSSAAQVVADVRERFPQVRTVFIDEVQHITDAPLFIKGVVDAKPPFQLVVSGSSAFESLSSTRESIAGRGVRVLVHPLSLSETLVTEPPLVGAALDQAAEDSLARHLVFGGYPEAWTSDHPAALLEELAESVVYRDASDLYRIQKPDAFARVARLAAKQVGNLVNLSEWASICAVDAKTVASYVYVLEEAHIAVPLQCFVAGKRRELTSAHKMFFVDNGMRNTVDGGFASYALRSDRGPLFENWVFTELLKSVPTTASLHYWRTKSGAEVDFVLSQGDRLCGIETKATAGQRLQLSRSARSFIEAYEPALFLVVSEGPRSQRPEGNTLVKWAKPQDVAGCVAEFGGRE